AAHSTPRSEARCLPRHSSIFARPPGAEPRGASSGHCLDPPARAPAIRGGTNRVVPSGATALAPNSGRGRMSGAGRSLGSESAGVLGGVQGRVDRAEAQLTADPRRVDDPFPGILELTLGGRGGRWTPARWWTSR